MSFILINGTPATRIDCRDRGLSYGDGLFETMRVQAGRIRLERYHLERLAAGLLRVGIEAPPRRLLLAELHDGARRLKSGVLKLMVTRGSGSRGYRPTGDERTTRILIASPLPEERAGPVRLRVCALVLAEQPLLAGIKSLNRLESVLARREWRSAAIFDGLLRDRRGNLVCGTMSNLFLRHERRLLTPSLRRCGVEGVMRRWVIEQAARVDLKLVERDIRWADLRAANEVFVSNAVVGLKSVRSIEWQVRDRKIRYADFATAQLLRERLSRL